MTANKIGIIVSHRLAMAKYIDEIIVMADGRIVERGHHDALVAQNGHYAEMFAKQSRAYRNDDD